LSGEVGRVILRLSFNFYTMKKILLVACVTMLFAGCAGSSDDETGYGDTSQVGQVEAVLGIDLPDDATVDIFMDGANGASVSGATAYSLDDTKDHFSSEMDELGGRLIRDWGTLNNLRASGQLQDVDYETLGMKVPTASTTATYMVDNKSWGFSISSDGTMQKFDIQMQK